VRGGGRCTNLSFIFLAKGMPATGEHVVADTAQREDVHHAGGAMTCNRRFVKIGQRHHARSVTDVTTRIVLIKTRA
jgi:S1-C subfamily serine protease